MSAQPQVVPMRMEIDDLDVDDEFEARAAESDGDKPGGIVGFIQSPVGLGAIGAVVVLVGAVAFFFGSGSVEGFGKPKLNNQSPNAEDSLALAGASVALEQVDLNVESEEFATGGDARISGNSAHGGGDRRELLEEVSAPIYGEISYSENGAIYHTSPTTVTVQIGEAQKDLSISLGILADRASAELLKQEGLKVNLLTIEAAQSVDFGPYLDWQIPGLITKDLRARIEAEYPETDVRAIMIRDFDL